MKFILMVLGLSLLGSIGSADPTGSALTKCYDIPGENFCALDAETIYKTMTIQESKEDDPEMGSGPNVIVNWRTGTWAAYADTFQCFESIPRPVSARRTYSCRYNANVADGGKAALLYLAFIKNPTSIIINKQEKFLTYNPYGKWPQYPIGSRTRGEQTLGIYTCWAEVEYDDLDNKVINLAASRGYCTVKFEKRL